MAEDVYCPMPFVHFAVRPSGKVLPCGRWLEDLSDIPSDLSVDLPDPREHAYIKNVQNGMLKGQRHAGCAKCYFDEANHIETVRTNNLKAYGRVETGVKVKNLEIAFSNLCNLACRHCGPEFSSKVAAEYEELHQVRLEMPVLRNEGIFDKLDLSEVDYLKIIGGEPLLEQKKFVQLISRLNLDNLELQICTNGTVLPNEQIQAAIKRCRKVKVDFSLDDVFEANDYFRYPSRFSLLEKNMKWFADTFAGSKQVHLHIHCVINVHNINRLNKILEWHMGLAEYWTLDFDFLSKPEYLSIGILPEAAKAVCRRRLSEWAKDHRFSGHHVWFAACLERLAQDQSEFWPEFVRITKRLDEIRGQKLQDVNPELADWMAFDCQVHCPL